MQSKNRENYEHRISPVSLMDYFQSRHAIESSLLMKRQYQANWFIYTIDELVEKITCIKIGSIPDIQDLVALFVQQYYTRYFHYSKNSMSLAEYHASYRNETIAEIRSMIAQYRDEIKGRARMVAEYFSTLADVQNPPVSATQNMGTGQEKVPGAQEEVARNSRRALNEEKSQKIVRKVECVGDSLATLEQSIDAMFAYIEQEMYPQTLSSRVKKIVRELLQLDRHAPNTSINTNTSIAT